MGIIKMANKPKDNKAKTPSRSDGGGGGKKSKKKWSKGKTRDKLQNAVFFDKTTYDKFMKEVPGYKLITPSVVSERLKIRGSLARLALKELYSKNLIQLVSKHHSQEIYTKFHREGEPEKEEVKEATKPTKKVKVSKKGKRETEEDALLEAEG